MAFQDITLRISLIQMGTILRRYTTIEGEGKREGVRYNGRRKAFAPELLYKEVKMNCVSLSGPFKNCSY